MVIVYKGPPGNETAAGFILLGFTDIPCLLIPMFYVFLIAYILSLVGNTLISVLIVSQQQLHTPMYFLMGNLAFVDICCTSVIIPRTLYGLMSRDTHISFHGCFIQLFLFFTLGNESCALLAIMAFDRYAAICFPLRYMIIMNMRTCISLLAFSWVIVCLHSAMYTVLASSQIFCSWTIQNFYCDLPVIMKLACPGTSYVLEKVVFIEGMSSVFGPVLFILGSYILIVKAVLALHSSKGRWKTFSTCSSHLTMVIILYSAIIFMYFRPSYMYTPTYDRMISFSYTIITPVLNPFIYCFRNKDVNAALSKMFKLHMRIR